MKTFKVFVVCLTLIFSLGLGDSLFADDDSSMIPNPGASIAASCEKLLEAYARNPSLGDMLEEIHNNHVEQVQMMAEAPGIALEEAGIINGAFLLAYSRNPDLLEDLADIRDQCLADIGFEVEADE